MYYGGWGWRPYVSVAQRQAQAMRKIAQLKKKGRVVTPVEIEGRGIATTFWGKAWCENLERYGDYANRLPRGRTYVRNGSVIDLQIAFGEVKALVSGSSIYKVAVKITPVSKARWKSICKDCAGAIDSLVELLQGRFSKGVMERICRENNGLFNSRKSEQECEGNARAQAGCPSRRATAVGISHQPMSFLCSGCCCLHAHNQQLTAGVVRQNPRRR